MSIHIITATYKDEHKLHWLNRLNSRFQYVVYRKNDNLQVGQEIILSNNLIEIPNIGRCDYAFLYHIIKNYDNLADRNVFVKCNWYENAINFDYLLNECQNYDFITKGTHPELIDWDYREDVDELSENYMDWLKEFFPNNHKNMGKRGGWGHGPCFSVSRELIHRHPKSVYEKLIYKFYPSSGSFKTDYIKYNYKSYNHLLVDISHRYHNELLRFYRLFFTHDLPVDHKFRIYEEYIPIPNHMLNKKNFKNLLFL